MTSRADYKRNWSRSNRDKVKRYNRQGYLRHRSERLRMAKEYAETHREQIRCRMKVYHRSRWKNPEIRAKLIEQTQSYARSHPHVRAKIALAYKRRHPEKWRALNKAHNCKRKAQFRGAQVDDKRVISVIKNWRLRKTFVCYYCRNRFSTRLLQVDHVQAIANSGKHTTANIAKSCPACNLRKRHYPVESLSFHGQQFLAV